jgi:hypothetical protein
MSSEICGFRDCDYEITALQDLPVCEMVEIHRLTEERMPPYSG